jgi:hypothetical protein
MAPYPKGFAYVTTVTFGPAVTQNISFSALSLITLPIGMPRAAVETNAESVMAPPN